MTASTTLTIRLTPTLKEKLGRIANGTRRSKSFLAVEALEAYVDRELRIIELIKEGIEDARAGKTIPHEIVMAEMRQVIAEAKARKVGKLA